MGMKVARNEERDGDKPAACSADVLLGQCTRARKLLLCGQHNAVSGMGQTMTSERDAVNKQEKQS